jgi:hypothetical protein
LFPSVRSNKFGSPIKQKTHQRWVLLEVPPILISNELLADMKKMADLYDYFGLKCLELFRRRKR